MNQRSAANAENPRPRPRKGDGKKHAKTQRLPDPETMAKRKREATRKQAEKEDTKTGKKQKTETQRLSRSAVLGVRERTFLDELLSRLYRNLDHQFNELNNLLKQSGEVNGKRILIGVLNLFYEQIQAVIPCHRVCFAIQEDDHIIALWARTAATEPLIPEGYSCKKTETSLSNLNETGVPRIIPDLEEYLTEHPDSESTRMLVEEGMRSSLTCPLNLPDHHAGYLFFSSMQPQAFGPDQERITTAMSERLPVILSKALFYREILTMEQRAQQLLLATRESDNIQDAEISLFNPEIETILCAHNDEVVRTVLRNVLSREGYRAGVFKQGDVILSRLEENPCDLVIVGAELSGASGLDICTRIRNEFGDTGVSVILILDDHRRKTVADAISHGADDIIFPPLNPTELLCKIGLLSQRRASFLVNTRPAVGSVFAGRYRIVQMIGSGGYSTIYYALENTEEGERSVALKIVELPPARANDQRYLSRLLREAYGHSRLAHRNIVKLYDFGQVGSAYYLAMEYIEGMSLMQMVENNGPFPEENLLFIAREAMDALVYLDRHGMIHRDIKAENFMLTHEGDLKLLDFGLTRRQAESTVSLEDEFNGTPQYASPEYILGGSSVNIRSDMYSLGVTLYFAGCGQFPFEGSSAIEVIRRHVDYTPPPLWQQMQGSISREFSDLVDWMLEKENAKRPTPSAAMKALVRLSE